MIQLHSKDERTGAEGHGSCAAHGVAKAPTAPDRQGRAEYNVQKHVNGSPVKKVGVFRRLVTWCVMPSRIRRGEG